MLCKKCGYDIEDGRVVCPNCDYLLYEDPDYIRAENKKKMIILGSIAGVILLFVFYHFLFTSPTYKMDFPGGGIAFKVKYQPLARCAIVEGKVLSCGARRDKKYCNISYSDYKQMQKNLKTNLNLYENLMK